MEDQNAFPVASQLKIAESINSAINYLYEHQLPNGEFCCYYSPDIPMQEWCVPDSNIFATCVIATSLMAGRHLPHVEHILKQSIQFLQYQKLRGSVWAFFTKWHPLFKFSPADVDSTVYASYLLKAHQIDFPSNLSALLNNRNSKGIFYTWFVTRPRLNIDFLKVAGREFKYLFKTIIFWNKHDARRNDIDAVVNANVLYFLELGDQAKPIVDYLIAVIHQEDEIKSDNWYKNPLIFYYAIARNFKKFPAFASVRDTIIKRTKDLLNENGSFGGSDLDTALAISTLIYFNDTQNLDQSVHYLLHKQAASGHWKRTIFFYSGPKKVVGWGSEEITTGYCLEALLAYEELKVKTPDL